MCCMLHPGTCQWCGHDPVFNEWVCLRVLNTWMIFGEHSFHFYPKFEGGMVLLLVPFVHTLQDGIDNLSLDVVEGKVTAD